MLYYIMRPESQPGWYNLLHSPTLSPLTAKHRLVKFNGSLAVIYFRTDSSRYSGSRVTTEREPLTGGPGAEPWSGGQGAKPHDFKMKAFAFAQPS